MSPKYAFNKNTAIERGLVRQFDIDQVRKMLSNKICPNLSDEQIVIFLLSCDNDCEKTLNTIRAYYESRRNSPELFAGRNVESETLQASLKRYQIGVFPKRTHDDCVMVFSKLNCTFSEFSFEESLKLLLMAIDMTLHEIPPKGLIIFFDMKDVNIAYMAKFKLGIIRKILYYLQEGIPIKLKSIHMMNTVYFIDKIMALFRPFMKNELFDKIKYHSSSNMEELYNYIPVDYLPEDYGGNLSPLAELHENFCLKLDEMTNFFNDEEKQMNQFINTLYTAN